MAPSAVDHRHEAHPSPFLLSVAEAQRIWIAADPAAAAILQRALIQRTFCGLSLWLLKDRIYIPASAVEIVDHVVQSFHRAGGSFSLHQSAGKALMMLNASGYHIPDFVSAFARLTESCSCKLNPRDPGDAKGGFLPFPQFAVRERVLMDWAHIPAESAEGYNYICVTMDAASRLCSLYAMRGAPKAQDSVAALSDWAAFADFPLSVSTDGGSHFLGTFRDFCGANDIEVDSSTPYHSAGRSPVERLIGVIKAALLRILAHGKTASWGATVSALQRALNASPHSSLAGLSPFQVFNGPDLRPLLPLAADGYPRSVIRSPAVAAAMDAARVEVRGANQVVSAMSSEHKTGLRASLSSTVTLPSYAVGSYVLAYAPGTRQHTMQSPFVGPCIVVSRGVNSLGVATGFYTLRECLPGYSTAAPFKLLYDRAMTRHVSDLKPFVWGGRTWEEVLSTRLPDGFGFVVEVTRGPDDEGRFECRFSSGNIQWLRQSQMATFSAPLQAYLAANVDARARTKALRATPAAAKKASASTAAAGK